MSIKYWKDINVNEKEQIRLMLFSLKEFSYGYEKADSIADQYTPGVAIMRFYMNSLYQYCANYFLDYSGNNLKQILKIIGSGDLLEPIENILSQKLGNTTFGNIIKDYRNKMLTHPNFLMSTVKDHVHKKYNILEPSNQIVFSGFVNDLFYQTQQLYVNICKRFPESVADES